MKREYSSPATTIVIVTASTIATSNGVGSSLDIEYGGIDAEGSLVPETKICRNIWDEEW